MRRGESLFEQTCHRAESLEGGAIKRRLICQLSKNFVENSEFTPADKPIVQHFVRAVLIRCILPLKSVLDDVDDAADDTPVIHTGAP